MRGVNRALILGRVGGDPDVKYTSGGQPIASFSVATSESWTDKSTSEKKERTEWHAITFFGRQAEIVRDYVKKGAKVYVDGKLQTDKWEKDGITHYKTKIVGQNIQLLDEKPKEDKPKPVQGQVIEDGSIPF